MSQVFNIYCDESCHLEHDQEQAMVLGALWCPLSKTREINTRIREIKSRHGLAADFEIKWTKVSKSKVQFYLDLVDYFFDDDDLHFRAVVVPDKSKLDHARYGQDHDTWYYKMYFRLLSALIESENSFRIYLDMKDTRSNPKIKKLYEVLANAKYDFERSIIARLQAVRSHEVAILQLADLLVGAISYANRGLSGNAGKLEIIERIKERSRLSLVRSTLLRETKLNIFVWEPREQ
ncbi:MAG: DUF3800 domain-containing protein [bacterium]